MLEVVLICLLHKGYLAPCRLQAQRSQALLPGSVPPAWSLIWMPAAAIPSLNTLGAVSGNVLMPSCRQARQDPGYCKPHLGGQTEGKAGGEDEWQLPCYSCTWWVAWQGVTAPFLFELTGPLNNLFIESELQETFQEQESWTKPGAAQCVCGGYVSILLLLIPKVIRIIV